MITGTTVVIVATIAVVVQSFFSGCEIAMVSANRSRLTGWPR